MPRRGRRRPAGQVGERDRHGILELVRQAAEPGSRARSRPPGRDRSAHGPRLRARRGAPVGRTGGSAWTGTVTSRSVEGRRSPVAVRREAGLQDNVQGSTAGGPQASAGPTRVPTPGCRSRPAGLARGRRRNAVATGYRSARSDRPWRKVLDVISVPRSLAAPSGKTYGTNPGPGRVNVVIHEIPPGPRADCPPDAHRCGQNVDNRPKRAAQPRLGQGGSEHPSERTSVCVSEGRSCRRGPRPDEPRAQPPRANISIFGRCSVAAARRSE